MAKKLSPADASCRAWDMPPRRACDIRPSVAQLEARRRRLADDLLAYAALALMLVAFVAGTAAIA